MTSKNIYQIVVTNNKKNYHNYLGCYDNFNVARKIRDNMQKSLNEDNLDYTVTLYFTKLYNFNETDKKALGL